MVNKSDVEKFEAFKATLERVPEDVVIRGLAQQVNKTFGRIIGTYSDASSTKHDRYKAVVDFGLPVMARHQLFDESMAKFPQPEPWIATARTELETRIEDNPGVSDVIRSTVYFSDDRSLLYLLNSKVNAVTPSGDYDARTFAAGVALGMIAVKS
jgi:hypothetical protein